MKFHVAVLTPFDRDHRVDLARLRAHVLWLAAEGMDGFLVTAMAGEFLYLSQREREAVHRTVIDAAQGRSVYPMTWDPSPTTTLYLTEASYEQGAAGVLAPPPLLYSLEDAAIQHWFTSIAGIGVPVWGWHDPHRLHTAISPHLYATLRQEGILAGLVDDSEDVWRLKRLAEQDPAAVHAGGDRILAKVTEMNGIAAFVSVLANAWPSFCLRLFRAGEHQLEDAMVERVNRVERAGGIRALKALLRMGCRSPLVEPHDDALMGLPTAEVPG